MKKILILFSILSFFSCKTKHIFSDKEKINSEIEEKTDLKESVKSSDFSVLEEKNKTNNNIIYNGIDFEIIPLDSSNYVTIIDANGGVISFKNASLSVKTYNSINKTIEEKTKKTNLKREKKEKKEINNKILEKKDIKKKIEEKKLTMNPLNYLYLLLLIICFIIWVYRKKIPFIKSFF